MKVIGVKEVKKGAKLLLKKQKIDQQLKQLAQIYHNQVGAKCEESTF